VVKENAGGLCGEKARQAHVPMASYYRPAF